MAQMRRGANAALTREVPGLTGLLLGVTCDAGAEQALTDNLVFAALLCTADGHVRDERDMVFFNQLASPEESVVERDRALGGDDEQIDIDLARVPDAVARIVAVLYVNEGPAQRRTLGQLRSCTVQVRNRDGGAELARSENLAPGFSTETAVALGEVYRHDGGWKFKVLGQGYSSGIVGVAADYGLEL